MQVVLMVTSLLSLYYLKNHSQFVGLGITYSLTISATLFGFLTSFIELEKNMIHAENIISYLNQLKSDQDHFHPIETSRFFLNGDISFNNVKLNYHDSIDVFPKGLNLKIQHGTKIGICGRTGSGKSSLIKLLFQIVSPTSGTITIDDIDIKELHGNLSSEMLLITQESTIFSQTLRFNLDPLKKIVCLDEATSNLDKESEDVLLELVHKSFKQSTIINISHRVCCLLKCDIIVVMKDGDIVEMNSVENLINNDSLFAQMLHQQEIEA
ncbi:hypothetical protein MXB_1878 [Myxobolus squamalis]|nr:hypothetical protein MXB_1878 [Myxobolus squamalis]